MALREDRERFGALFFYAALVLLAYFVFRVFEPFLAPLGWAAVLVVVFYPAHTHIERRWGATRAAALSTLAVTFILIVPTLLVMTAFVRQGMAAAQGLPQALAQGKMQPIERAWEWIGRHSPAGLPSDLGTLARQAAERWGAFLAAQLGSALRNIAVFFFHLFVMIFAMFYLFRDAAGILGGVRRVLPFAEPHRERLIAQARELIFASVTSSLIVAAVHGLFGGLAFALVGLGAPIFWGVVMSFFSFLPVVGASIIWVPAAGWLLLNGQIGRGIVLVVLCAVVVGVVEHFLRPALISGQARLSGLLVFIGVLGGIAVFGMLGVVLGPIVVATAASLLEVYLRRDSLPEQDGETVGRTKAAMLE